MQLGVFLVLRGGLCTSTEIMDLLFLWVRHTHAHFWQKHTQDSIHQLVAEGEVITSQYSLTEGEVNIDL